MRTFIAILLLFFSTSSLSTDFIKVGIFSRENIQSTLFQVEKGSYKVIADGIEVGELTAGQNLKAIQNNSSIIIEWNGQKKSNLQKIVLQVNEWDCEFRLKSIIPSKKAAVYQDNLVIKHLNGKLRLISEIDIEKYVSGVVEAEAGSRAKLEFYKAQAIISRTYALANKARHRKEGYHLCDKVHCQVYHGKSFNNEDITKAAYLTKGNVLVDSNIDLITAAFHSNCGGHTVNAENVWIKSLPYLVGVVDTFCMVMPHSHWEKSINKKSWLDYLSKKNYTVPGDSIDGDSPLAYFPDSKRVFFGDSAIQIPVTTIRKDWKLRSTFFTIHEYEDEVLFTGRGFGHGVGLCQEGAMRMATLGMDYQSILHFYYTDVHLIDKRVLEFFRDEEMFFIDQ